MKHEPQTHSLVSGHCCIGNDAGRLWREGRTHGHACAAYRDARATHSHTGTTYPHTGASHSHTGASHSYAGATDPNARTRAFCF